ncbi:signal peptide peptidase SppA [Adlercreutzia murintestinalis]|uniref:signal peptide peptidase SppA n=1 Tax=Adlercreutzia murintestinalis TaxID=2941325 RepID=UPI00203AB424|nr:signal peptide peptidase SppA [Adlercreutzia murintestinalis]
MSQEPQNAYDQTYGASQPSAAPGGTPVAGQTAMPTTDAAAQPQAQPTASAAQTAPSQTQAFSQSFSDAGQATPQPVYAAPAAPQKSGKGWIVGIVVIVAVAIVCIVGMASCSTTMSAMMNPFGSLYEDEGGYAVYEPSVGIIELDGTIQYDGSVCSPEGLKELLDQAEDDDDIVAVVLRVNSGGGVATAGEEMAQYVADFSKPIVVSSAATNASAAYEISSQADMIFVDKTTMIGSIGVILQVSDLSGLYDKLGIRIDNITSADAKDAGGGTRPLTEDERAYYQAMVDQINDLFVKTVAEGRGMKEDEVRKLATGLPFTGVDAVENGLADEIGLLEDAVAAASEEAGYGIGLPTVSLTYAGSDLLGLLDMLGYSESDLGDAAKLETLIAALEDGRALG